MIKILISKPKRNEEQAYGTAIQNTISVAIVVLVAVL